ncbi:unnamed protein product [Porites lobata]|uniref:acid phosphatase n=1 Tax=Porites lobata TaxID=104759 RepID=A0ABN8R7T8_9CNID|nr:unnamed protein product [Porites lobata]
MVHFSYLFCCLFVGFSALLLSPATCQEDEVTMKLVMVNAVYRHGDRSPTHIYPNDPWQEDVWPQGMGMLTQKGMRQEYALGEFLKSRYMRTFKLLNSTYIYKQLYIRSSDKDRCLMSAQTQLNGLYPPRGHQIWRDHLDWQPIGIHVVPKKDDYLLRPFDYNCPRFFKLHDEDKKQLEYIQMSKKYKDMLAYVSENTGEKVDVSTTYKITDPLISEASHGLAWPDWVNNGTTYKDLRTVANFGMYWNFNTREKARLTGGALVGRMIDNMKLMLSPPDTTTEPVRKAYLYSAHDTTVSAFLSALLAFNRVCPDYSSAAILELFRSTNDSVTPQFFVRLVYRFGQTSPEILKIPGCDTFCPLEKFIELTADVIPVDVAKECALEQEKCTCIKVIDYNAEGCYKDSKKKSKKIFTKKFSTVNGVNRRNPDVEEIFLECKEMAEKEGYEIFAIQNVNMCVTTANGKVADFQKFGESKGCIVNKQGHGVGKKRAANFVYTA